MSDPTGWHPLGLSHSVEAGSSAGTRLFGSELVVWRDTSGVAHVWQDRCPHRGMKLSFGFVRGDHIACLYHGWQYDRAGYCQYIPAHPDLDVPKTFKVPVYQTQERGGMIWTTLDADPSPLPPADDEAVPLRSLYLDAGIDAAMAALGAARLIPFGSDGLADTAVDRLAENLYSVHSGNDRLLIGVQIISETRMALHLSISGPRALYEGAGQRHFNGWALDLRHRIDHARERQPAAALRAPEPLR